MQQEHGRVTYSFANQSVLVTGGAQGIGFEIAKGFLNAGARVTIADYAADALTAAEKELKPFGDVRTARLDVTDRASCAALAKSLGPLNVLINNAGITRDKSLAKMEASDFDQVIQTNLTGVFNVTKACLDTFATDGGPKRIINIASVVALYGNFGQTNYAAAKAGVVGMTRTWAKELGRKGFTSNAVAPGFIRTKMTDAMPAEVLNGITAKVPVQRLGETSDIANACMFLASEGAAYVNGTVLSVDGGLVL